ncbi:alpha/beta hydrolase [Natronospira bacteriovora]|uniref:Alpha/beta hydrolase n=1 Tax=Natronospira bacteriovora TaxID=3069753 RepID=A0ABU0W4E4_9GAMM|nr:alpha/beta hydrolase [Natronospira sp. AB-CW4]MDQ2068884.1 alpha/beta hydrolase [Natronospira sp. AB-CW4]
MKPHNRLFLVLILLCMGACASYQGHIGDRRPLDLVAFDTLEPQVYTPPHWPQALEARVRIPRTQGPHPAVLLVHGGGWQRGSPGSMEGIARRLARQGLVTVNVDYRFAPAHRFPAQLHDLQLAMHWLHEQADELDINPNRIAAFGFSSGGHLVSLLTVVAGQGGELDQQWGGPRTRPAAVVLGGSPSDLRLWEDGRLVVDFLGGTRAEMPETYAQASPLVHVHDNGLPPFFLFHATRDRIVSPEHSEQFHARLQEKGVPSELHYQCCRGHFSGFIFRRVAMMELEAFLLRELAGP